MAAEVEDIDVCRKMMGDFGKWQLKAMLMIFLCKIPTSWFMAVIIFTAPAPGPGDYWCRPPNTVNVSDSNDWIKLSNPWVPANLNEKEHYDACHVYKNVFENATNFMELQNGEWKVREDLPDRGNETVACESFEFKSRYYSLVARFSLVCSRTLMLALSQSFHILGLLIGGIIAYYLVRVISPRYVMLTGMIMQIVCGNATGMVRTYELHVLCRCLSASTCALMYTSGSAILADITHGKAKIITSVIFELFWSIGLILLPGLTIFFTNYTHLYMAVSMPTIVLIFLHRQIPNSPRWYLRRGDIRKAKQIVLMAATTNKIKIPDNLDNKLKIQAEAFSQEPAQARWLKLWDGKPRKRHIFAVHYAWAIYILLFNSMVLNIRSFGLDHIHINTVAMGLSEIVGVFIGLYLILYTRRRWLWTGVISITAGSFAYLTWMIPNDLYFTQIVALEMLPCIAIKVATSSSLSILTTCTSELVDPERQKTLQFSASVWARAWFVWAPYINTTKSYGPLIPLTIFATLSVVGGLLTGIINHSHHKNHQKRIQQSSPSRVNSKGDIELPHSGVFTSKSDLVRQTDALEK